MGKQHLSRDDRIFMDGKRRGTQECMDMVAMALIDKCGWHVQEETPDSRDTVLRRDAQIADMSDGLAQFAKAVAEKEEK